MRKLLTMAVFCVATVAAIGQTMETINVGTSANSGTGDNLRAAMIKVNNNFTKLSDTTQAHNDRLKALESGSVGTNGDTVEFSDGSRIYGGGGEIDIQPATGISAGTRMSFYTSSGGNTLNMNSNGKHVILDASVLELPGYTSAQDSFYLDYIGGASITGGVYLLLSPTQAIDTGKATVGAIGMRMKLVPIYDLVADTVNGEMRWWYFNKSSRSWKQTYGVVNSDPIATDEAHTVQIELLTRYIFDLQKQIDAMKPRRLFTRRVR